MTNVVDQVVATGSLAPATVYGLAFGQVPTLVTGIEQLQQLQQFQRIGQHRLAGQDGQRRRGPDGQEG